MDLSPLRDRDRPRRSSRAPRLKRHRVGPRDYRDPRDQPGSECLARRTHRATPGRANRGVRPEIGSDRTTAGTGYRGERLVGATVRSLTPAGCAPCGVAGGGSQLRRRIRLRKDCWRPVWSPARAADQARDVGQEPDHLVIPALVLTRWVGRAGAVWPTHTSEQAGVGTHGRPNRHRPGWGSRRAHQRLDLLTVHHIPGQTERPGP
jgi:hypothetical protein